MSAPGDSNDRYERWAALIVLVVVLVILVFCGGCRSTSPGRFTLGEWNSMSPEQMTAVTEADTALYESPGESVVRDDKNVDKSFSAWTELAKIISGLRVRIRVLCIEWGPTLEQGE